MINNDKIDPGAVLIDGHGRADLGIVRALGERGVDIYLLSDDRVSPVCYSKYITRIFSFPGPDSSDEEKLSALRSIGEKFRNKPVFFSTGDKSLLLFSRNREVLQNHYHHHIGDQELMEKCNDKMQFAKLAEEKSLSTPVTSVPSSLDELERDIERLSFPVMVKPSEKKNWDRHPEIYNIVENLKGVKVETPDKLINLYKELSPYDRDMVIQDYIEGRDEAIFSLHIYIKRNGQVAGWFTGQKIRTFPIHRGIGCFQLSTINEEVRDLGIETLQKIGYTGHAIVQVKKLPETDVFQIFEINCRYSTWAYLHTRAGVNLPYAAYKDSMGMEVKTLPIQREGARWIDGGNDLKAFRDYRRIGEWKLLPWARTYVGDNCYAFFSMSDVKPWLAMKNRRILSKVKKRSEAV